MQATSCQAHDDNTACGVSDTVSKSADRQREWSDWLAHDDDISYFLGVEKYKALQQGSRYKEGNKENEQNYT